MDSRHESFKEAFLNHLITTINSYINNHLDNLISNVEVQNEIQFICKRIYHYLEIEVDVNGILSKHNLLSIDVVLFPIITDPEANIILTKDNFQKLINEIKIFIEKNNQSNGLLRKKIIYLFDEYQLCRVD